MRFLLVSADEPTVKKSIDIPDRLVKDIQRPKNVKRIKSKKKNFSTEVVDAINKQHQTSKSIISLKQHNGRSIHRRDKRGKAK
jgi:uncharacterized protein (UPF0147 family)